jgi:hypothetical protein
LKLDHLWVRRRALSGAASQKQEDSQQDDLNLETEYLGRVDIHRFFR